MMFKPTLAIAADFAKIQYPVFASAKLDGIRCSIVNNMALTRTLKAVPNKYISSLLSSPKFNGLDGELIVGPPTDKQCYTNSVSNVMAYDKLPEFHYYVFDVHNSSKDFSARYEELQIRCVGLGDNIRVLDQVLIHNENSLLQYEEEKLNEGYEGLILRSLTSPYKFGRSTVNEGYMLKVKRFEDSEALIIGYEEEMFNGNQAETNELGRTKRSTAKAGLAGKSTLGAFLVRDIHSGVEFSIGTGLTAHQRAEFWNSADRHIGKTILKYKFFPVGVKDKPRHPVFLGLRSRDDI